MDTDDRRSAGNLLRGLLALLPFLLLAAPRVQAQVRFGDVEVSVAESIAGGSHGYAEYRLRVSNRSAERAHRVRLGLPRDSSVLTIAGFTIREVSRTVDVPPRSSLSVSLLQPALPLLGSNLLGVWVDGELQQESVPVSIRHAATYYSLPSFGALPFSVTASRQADDFVVLLQRAQEAVKGSTPSSTRTHLVTSMSIHRSPFDHSEWSSNWLAYSSADGIVVSSQDLESLPAEVRAALFGYLEAGGFLAVLGEFAAPPHWERAQAKLPGSNAYRAVFGRCAVVPRGSYLSWASPDWDSFFDSLEESSEHLKAPRASNPNKNFPVAEDLEVPIRGLFLFMILFFIAVGPVNVFLVSRIHKRIWLWWTVPAIALATTAAVAGYTLISEGFRSHVRSESLTYLDEHRRWALSAGILGLYSTLTPSQGLRFDRLTELTLLPGMIDSSSLHIDWTEGQHLASGWIQARIPVHFLLRKAESRLERLPFRRLQDGSVSALNGLGAPIRQLAYQSPDGTIYQAQGIAPGEEKRLQVRSSGHSKGERIHLLNQFYYGRLPLEELFQKPQDYLSAGRYLAELQGSPFLESGLPQPKTSDHKAVVYGICQEAP